MFNVRHLLLQDITLQKNEVYFIYTNTFNSLRHIARDFFNLVTQQQNDNIEDLQNKFLIIAIVIGIIILIASGIFIPFLSKVPETKETIISLFLQIPLYNIKNLLSKSQFYYQSLLVLFILFIVVNLLKNNQEDLSETELEDEEDINEETLMKEDSKLMKKRTFLKNNSSHLKKTILIVFTIGVILGSYFAISLLLSYSFLSSSSDFILRNLERSGNILLQFQYDFNSLRFFNHYSNS